MTEKFIIKRFEPKVFADAVYAYFSVPIFTSDLFRATQFESYGAALETINELEPGYLYQIEKFFIV